jgi:hypothetical protein
MQIRVSEREAAEHDEEKHAGLDRKITTTLLEAQQSRQFEGVRKSPQAIFNLPYSIGA